MFILIPVVVILLIINEVRINYVDAYTFYKKCCAAYSKLYSSRQKPDGQNLEDFKSALRAEAAKEVLATLKWWIRVKPPDVFSEVVPLIDEKPSQYILKLLE
jgi:hypothetical protein